MNRIAIAFTGFCFLACTCSSAFAQTEANAAPASSSDNTDERADWIEPVADIRYRYEFVDQEDFELDAYASTLRARLGVRFKPATSLVLFAEGEAVVHVGPEKFNDTTNGVIGRPIVADPEDLLLNQLYARWSPRPGAAISAGRQAVNYDNQRWIGSVGWRQNDQTLDAITGGIERIGGSDVVASYGYAWRVNRVFGPDSPQGVWENSDIHMVRLGSPLGSIGKLTAYGYWLDIPEAPAASSRTMGVRLAGDRTLGAADTKITYALEVARQSPKERNPSDDTHSYWLVEPGLSFGSGSVKLGYERLEGNGVSALQTPLATLHAFNGWADRFLVTPPTGLRDLYLDAGYTVPKGVGALSGTGFRFAFHDYTSTAGDLKYGREWNASIARPLSGPVFLTLKFADYDAAEFSADTTKAWIQLDGRF